VAWYHRPMRHPGLLVACVILATASLVTIAVCAVRFTLRSAPVQVAVDPGRISTEVADVIEHKYASGTLTSTSCPSLQVMVTSGTTFACTIELSNGTTEHARVTVNSDGGYDVDPPG
jgi:hypothetical protein